MAETDRVALVTGASSGIGEATVRTLAREGYAVALAARREHRLTEIAREIDDERTLVVPTDITDESDVDAMVEETRKTLGEIDLLVNNAGVIRPGGLRDADMADLRNVTEVNLLGTMNTTWAALPSLLASGGGDVVTVASIHARYPTNRASGYTATKFGVTGFCRSLRKEVAKDGVRVTILMPGAVVTEMSDWENWDGHALDPADVADTIAYVVSRPDHVSIPELTITPTDMVLNYEF